jgi:thymidylate synthase (FAD)
MVTTQVDVLDHGYVKLIDSMGTDITPAESARRSYGATARGWDEGDGKLIERLLRDGHTSPFEFNEIVLEMQAPIFVARQLVRHRTASWSEFSMRYADASRVSGQILFYTPDQFRLQSGINAQLSYAGTLDESVVKARYRAAVREALGAYNDLIVAGVAREQARAVLPTCVYTKWRWKQDFHNLTKMLKLRNAPDAQYETQLYAQAVREIALSVWPQLGALAFGQD